MINNNIKRNILYFSIVLCTIAYIAFIGAFTVIGSRSDFIFYVFFSHKISLQIFILLSIMPIVGTLMSYTCLLFNTKVEYFYILVIAISNIVGSGYLILNYNKYNYFIPITISILSCLTFFCILRYVTKLNHASTHDALTGLFNRHKLIEDLSTFIRTKSTQFSNFLNMGPISNTFLFFMDLDNFKRVNDTFGHSQGDKLLQEFASIIKDVKLGSYTMPYRLGGDEFALFVTNSNLEEATKKATLIIKSLKENKFIANLQCKVTASIGICEYDPSIYNAEKFLSFADRAMYFAKNNGKNTFKIFDHNLKDEFENFNRIEKIIKKALKNEDYIQLHYQPQFEIDTKRIKGFEALSRIYYNDEIIMPNNFIPVAESSGQIIEFDNYIIRKSFRDFKPLIEKDPSLLLALNISGNHAISKSFYNDIVTIAEDEHFPFTNIELEITEIDFIKSVDIAVNSLEKLCSLGIKVSLDDFGEKYSSLKYLYKLPLSFLKVNRNFVTNITNSSRDKKIISAIINIAESFGYKTIIEGVETKEQLETIKQLGGSYIQGYIWGKPIRKDDLLGLI